MTQSAKTKTDLLAKLESRNATVAIIGFNLMIDFLYAWIDPRIRLA